MTGADGSRAAGPLPADHHPARPPPLPRRAAGPALPRAVGNRVRLPTRCATPCSTAGSCAPATGPALEQETWALLALYQLLRMAMTDATATRPRHRPRPGQLHHRPASRPRPAHHRPRHHPRDPSRPRRHRPRRPGQPCCHARRPRYSARTVKSQPVPLPQPATDDPRPALPAAITAITITITTPAPGISTRPAPRTAAAPQPGTRRHRRHHPHEHRPRPPLDRPRTRRAPPASPTAPCSPSSPHWTRTGHLTRTSPGTYALHTPPHNHWTNPARPLTTRHWRHDRSDAPSCRFPVALRVRTENVALGAGPSTVALGAGPHAGVRPLPSRCRTSHPRRSERCRGAAARRCRSG